MSAFVVASDEENPFRILHFERQQQEKGFHTVVPSVHVVSQEQVVRVRDFPPYFEQFDQVVELTVDIPADLSFINLLSQAQAHLSRSTRFEISPLLSDKEFSLPALLLFHSFIVFPPTSLCPYSSTYLIFIS